MSDKQMRLLLRYAVLLGISIGLRKGSDTETNEAVENCMKQYHEFMQAIKDEEGMK